MADPAFSSNEGISFNITIDDTSPVIVYVPSVDNGSNTSSAWVPCYSSFGASICDGFGQNNDISLHATSLDGASLTFEWIGTAVALYGYFPTASPSYPFTFSYSVSLDGSATTNYASAFPSTSDITQDVLVSFTNLTNKQHSLELVMHNPNESQGGLLLIDRVIITASVPGQSNSDVVATELFPDSAVSYHGQWSFERDLLPGQNASFHLSTNVGDSASMQFNGTAITLSGLTTPLSGSYNVTVDNEAPTTLSAHSPFNSSTVLFFRTGLDSSVSHQLQIVNVGPLVAGEGTLLAVGSINVTSVMHNGGSTPQVAMPSSSLPRGAIVGIAIGVSFAALVLLMLVVVLLRRRRRAVKRKQGFIVNPHISNPQRFSFLRKVARAQQEEVEVEKEQTPNNEGVLDITGRKDNDDEEMSEEHDISEAAAGFRGGGSRHASQNSDGSYSIKLPELSKDQARTPEDISYSIGRPILPVHPDAQSGPSQTASAPHSPIPRSPKPRGPRDMHSLSLPSHNRDGSQGILLREMYSAAADVPTDVRASEYETPTTVRRSFLPTPTISPLRVNFEGDLVEHAQRSAKEGKHKSFSAMSLPHSLRQVFSWGHYPHRPTTLSVPSDAARKPDTNHSFLDMESSISGSVSGSASRSARNSHTTSTHSTSRSHRHADDSEWSAPGRGAPPLPREHRASMGFSMTIAGGPTSSRPSLSPDISLQAVPLPQLVVSEHPAAQEPQDVPQSAHPHELSELPSPTESLPLSVSEIHFRHSSSQSSTSLSESRRGSRRVSQRTSHPPLPSPQSTEPAQDRPYIVQKLLGQLSTESAPTTPYSSPTIPSFRPTGPRASSGRGNFVGPSFGSAMSRQRTS